MERFVNTFDRNTSRTPSRSGFRIISADQDVSQVVSKPVQVDAEPILKDEVKVAELPVDNVCVKEEPSKPVIADNELPKTSFIVPEDTVQSAGKPIYLGYEHAVIEGPVIDIKDKDETETIVKVDEKALLQEKIDSLQATIDILTLAIQEKDDYIAKLKEYAQITDEELSVARAQNKTLIDVTGKFIMKI